MTVTKRIAITGCSGFLGQHLLHSLMTKGPSSDDARYEVLALCGSLEGFASRVVGVAPHSSVTVTMDQLDLTKEADVTQWVSCNQPFDICLHLAAVSSPGRCQENAEMANAVNCPVAFFRALAKANVPVVTLSTDQVYNGKNAPYLETSELGPVNVYASTKVAMEKALMETHANKFVALRSSIIAGPEAPFGDAHSTFLHFCKSRKEISTDFFTDECRSVVAVSNVVACLTFFVENGAKTEGAGIYNMGGKDRVSRYDMALAVARHFGFDEQYVVAKRKADQSPPAKIPSPLDIAMDSSGLERLVGTSFLGFKDIVKETFGETTAV